MSAAHRCSIGWVAFWRRRSEFIRDHPPSFDDQKGVEQRQVISMQMPPLPDQQRFYSALLFEIGAPHNPKAGVSVLETLTRTLLRVMKPRMLVVDEVHHLLAGNYREQRAALNLLKYLDQRSADERGPGRNSRCRGGLANRPPDEQPLYADGIASVERERSPLAA